jgi:hypothetical protein
MTRLLSQSRAGADVADRRLACTEMRVLLRDTVLDAQLTKYRGSIFRHTRAATAIDGASLLHTIDRLGF